MLVGLKSHQELESLGYQPRGQAGKYTKYYTGKIDNKSFGYIAIDFLPDLEVMGIYELFVLPEQRCKGYGSHLLLGAEELGKIKKYKKISLKPEPLRGALTKEKLIQWYSHRGYQNGNLGEMEKIING